MKQTSKMRSLGIAAVLSLLLIAAAPAPVKIKIMPLGDSITSGNQDMNSYRRALWKQLQAAGYTNVDFVGSQSLNNEETPPNPDFDLDNEGWWGYKAGQIVDLLTNGIPDDPGLPNIPVNAYPADIVLLHIGTNDMSVSGDAAVTTALDNITKIVGLLRAKNPKVAVLLAQIIPCMQNPQGANVVNFNTHIPALVAGLSTTASPVIQVDQFTGITKSDMFDSWHPGPTGQAKMATKWFNALKPILDKQPTAALPRITASRSERPGLSASSIAYNIRGQVIRSNRSSASGWMIGRGGTILTAAKPERRMNAEHHGWR